MTTATVTPDTDLDSIIRKIVKMVDKAEHANTPAPEAETARRMVAEWMDRYDLQEHMISQARPAERQVPVMKRIMCYPVDASQDGITGQLTTLLQILARHVHVRLNFDWKTEIIDGENWYMVSAVGYESDIRFLEILFVSLRMHVMTNLSSRWNTAQTLDENVVRLHEAGVGYDVIADLAVKAGFPEFDRGELTRTWVPAKQVRSRRGWRWMDGYEKKDYTRGKASKAKLMRVYDAYCKKNGREKVLAVNPANYRMWFLDGYVSMIRHRVAIMAEMRRDTMRKVDEETGSAAGTSALAIRDRSAIVDEAFYNFFPRLRPVPESEQKVAAKGRRRGPGSRGGRTVWVSENATARHAGSNVAKTADLSGGRNHVSGKRGIES